MSTAQGPIDRVYAIIERDGVSGLTEAELGLFTIYWFVAETNNGGVHQFLFNDSGEHAQAALRYLEQIGTTRTASILRRAIALFPGGTVPTDRKARRTLLNTMNDQGVSFNALTRELYSCGEDVSAFHDAYASAHPELFARINGDAVS